MDSTSLPPESYNILSAASTDGGGLLSLWDIRCKTLAGAFRGHTNRTEKCCRTSFSPCMRYVTVGSEGNCGSAVLYDLRGAGGGGGGDRKGPIVARLGRSMSGCVFKDGTVTDVQFNPLYPQIATASLDGRIRFYTENL
eukprot:14665791-Ditylum_brightwellii.AAC.1